MAYFKKTIRTGMVVEVEKYQRSNRRPKKDEPRAAKELPTPEQVALVNERNAEKKLRWTINANFAPGDLHVVLTYQRAHRPDTQGARQHLDRYMRKLRLAAAEKGTELKYITVTEYKSRAVHHHLIVQGVAAETVAALWVAVPGHGRAHITPLDNSGQYKDLAAYLIKETAKSFREGSAPYRKRWNESRNLLKVQPKVKKINAKQWRETPFPEKGYYIETDSVEVGANPVTGLMWQRYSMRKVPPRGQRQKKQDVMRC